MARIMDLIPADLLPGLIKEIEEQQQAEKKQSEEKQALDKNKVSTEMKGYLERKKAETKN